MHFLLQEGVDLIGAQTKCRWHTSHNGKDIVAVPAPENKQHIISLLGAVNYYSKFLPQLATLAHPLYKLLRDDQAWMRTSVYQWSFDDINDALASMEVPVRYGA